MSQASSKKRKPNAFEGNHTPSKKQRKQLTPAKNKLLSPDPSTLVSDEVPFKVECPARKVPNKGKKQAGKDDVFGPALEDGGFPNLTISYAIRPGKAWAELKIFRNFSSEFRSVRSCAEHKVRFQLTLFSPEPEILHRVAGIPKQTHSASCAS